MRNEKNSDKNKKINRRIILKLTTACPIDERNIDLKYWTVLKYQIRNVIFF